MNKIRFITIAGVALVLWNLALSDEMGPEVASEQDIGFQAEYEDGTVENMVVRYQAIAGLTYVRVGSASHGIEHLQDTRRCSWEAWSYIQRDLCVDTKTAGQICKGQYTRIFNDTRRGGTRSQDILKGQFNVKTCDDVMSQLTDAQSNNKTNVVSQLKPVMDNDIDQLFDTLKNSGGVKRTIMK